MEKNLFPFAPNGPTCVGIAPSCVAEHCDRRKLMGMGALLPKTLTRRPQDICWRILAAVNELKMQWGNWEVSVTDARSTRRALRPETWTRPNAVGQRSRLYVFDRFPKDPFGSEAEQVARQAFVRWDFPNRLKLTCTTTLGIPEFRRPLPPFPPRSAAAPPKAHRYHCHVRARFSRLVRGPMVAGAGRITVMDCFGHYQDERRPSHFADFFESRLGLRSFSVAEAPGGTCARGAVAVIDRVADRCR